MTSAKTYWSILKMFLNNKKIPCIPPLFHQGKYVTAFKKKAEPSNSFFAKPCSTIRNSSKLPLTLSKNKQTNKQKNKQTNKKTQKSRFQVLLLTAMILQQLLGALILTKLKATIQ